MTGKSLGSTVSVSTVAHRVSNWNGKPIGWDLGAQIESNALSSYKQNLFLKN